MERAVRAVSKLFILAPFFPASLLGPQLRCMRRPWAPSPQSFFAPYSVLTLPHRGISDDGKKSKGEDKELWAAGGGAGLVFRLESCTDGLGEVRCKSLWRHPEVALSSSVKSKQTVSVPSRDGFNPASSSMSRTFPFSWKAPGRQVWGFPEFFPHNVSLLTLLQELLESRLKVLKKDLENYEVFRSTEEKESKELLVSWAPPGGPPLGSNRGPVTMPHPLLAIFYVWCWSVYLWNSRGGF